MSEDQKIAALSESIEKGYKGLEATKQPWSPELVGYLGGGLLLFCLLVLAIAAYVMKGKDVDASVMMKWFGLTLILCLSAFLMIVGYGEAQLTPVVGLFGAIAGYLLGKDKKET